MRTCGHLHKLRDTHAVCTQSRSFANIQDSSCCAAAAVNLYRYVAVHETMRVKTGREVLPPGTPAYRRRPARWLLAWPEGGYESWWMYVISMLHLISIVAALLVCALIATQFAALSNVHSRESGRTLPGTRFQPLRFATAGSAFVGGLASSTLGLLLVQRRRDEHARPICSQLQLSTSWYTASCTSTWRNVIRSLH